MKRERFIKLSIALCEKLANKYENRHIDGTVYNHYKDLDITKLKANSYKEAWEMLKPARDCVGM